MGNVRINILARALAGKARVSLDVLPGLGSTEKKTHSSSIGDDLADKVRAHFRAAEQAELDAQRKVQEEKKAAEAEVARKEAEAKAAAEAALRPAPPAAVQPISAAATPATPATSAASPTAPATQPVTRILRKTSPAVVSPSDKPSRPPTGPPSVRRPGQARPGAGFQRRPAAAGAPPGAVPGGVPG